MVINFNEMKMTATKNMLGGEKEVFLAVSNDGVNKILNGKLIPGASIGMHTHKTSSEIIYILSGNAKVKYQDTVEVLPAGSCHYCPKGHTHSLFNDSNEDVLFFAVVPEQ